jgi:exodeoxyribonuclease VII large subunit
VPSLRETTAEAPAPVRAVSNALSQWIGQLGTIWVEGQVTQFTRRPGLGTVFLTLRDPVAEVSVQVTCARTLFDSLNPPLVEGASIVIRSRPTFYAGNGSLSLAASDIRMVGLGELLARLERRRRLLAAEGLFDPARKRRLPFLPGCVGLVTAPGSAAERDVVDNARRRWPAVRIETAYAAMQGQRSALEVIEAVERLDRDPDVDVIVVARGGGSVEDLLPFSDEGLVRAATPTDAAKRVVPDVAEELQLVDTARDRLRSGLAGLIAREQQGLDALRSRPVLADPRTLVAERASEVSDLRDRSRRSLRHLLDRAADNLDHQRARVRSLSPLATLERGYAVLQDAAGQVVTSVAAVDAGTAVSIRVADGRVHATTTGTEHDPTEEAGRR